MFEHLAKMAERIGREIHSECPDPQEDASDITGEKIAEAIRAASKNFTIRIYATDNSGERFEIEDLYWFEENSIHTWEDKGREGFTFDFEIVPKESKVE